MVVGADVDAVAAFAAVVIVDSVVLVVGLDAEAAVAAVVAWMLVLLLWSSPTLLTLLLT